MLSHSDNSTLRNRKQLIECLEHSYFLAKRIYLIYEFWENIDFELASDIQNIKKKRSCVCYSSIQIRRCRFCLYGIIYGLLDGEDHINGS